MRKSIFYLASMAIMTIGCQAELEQDNPAGDLSKGMFTASTESSADVKTSMNQDADNDKVYNIHWTEGDKVLVSDGSVVAEFVATPSADPTVANLSTTEQNVPSEGAEKYYAVFPAVDGASAGPDGYTVVIPSTQTWEKGEFDMPMVGVGGSDMNISFMNAASILKITPNNLCDSYDKVRVKTIEVCSETANIAGNVAVSYDGESVPVVGEVTSGSKTITLDCGEEGAEFSETFYIALVPGSYESLTIKITSNGGGSQTFTLNTPAGKRYERSKYASVGVKISNLAIFEPANCYLIKRAGTYKFPVNIKGNGNNKFLENSADPAPVYEFSVPSINVSEIKGIDVTVISQKNRDGEYELSQTLTDVALNGEYMTFTVPEDFIAGNIHIGVYPNETCQRGTCLWSWHIWVNSDVEDVDTGKWHDDFGRVSLLNVNLGSLQTADELTTSAGNNSGLYYQWGRKDPFPSGNTLPSDYTIDEACDNTTQHRVAISKSIQYPKVFYSGVEDGSAVRSWCNGTVKSGAFFNEAASDLWGGVRASIDDPAKASNVMEKSMFDPCPPGYHVITAFGFKTVGYNTYTKQNNLVFEDSYMYHKKYTDLILPYDGCRTQGTINTYSQAGQLTGKGSEVYYWSANYFLTSSHMEAVALRFTTKEVGEEAESMTVAAPVKLNKSFACSVRAQKQ